MVVTSGFRGLYITVGGETNLPLPDQDQRSAAGRPAASQAKLAPAKTSNGKPDIDEAGSC